LADCGTVVTVDLDTIAAGEQALFTVVAIDLKGFLEAVDPCLMPLTRGQHRA